MNKNMEPSFLKTREYFPWVLAAITVLTANWASEGFSSIFKALFGVGDNSFSWLYLLYITSFVIMVTVLFRKRNALFGPRTRYLTNQKAEKRKHLVLFLSNLPKELEKSNGIPKELALSDDLDKDIILIERRKQADPPMRWSWEMPLRAIRHHFHILETVTLICSEQSFLQCKLFLDICYRYKKVKDLTFYLLVQKDNSTELIDPLLTSIKAYEGFDFASFDELSGALLHLLRDFQTRKYSEHDIMIDFTGGQKVTSVVAASVTFNRRIKAEYVQTNRPWNVLSYDVMLASSDTGSLGL